MQSDTVGMKFKKHVKQHYISYRDKNIKNIKIYIGLNNIKFRIVVILGKKEQTGSTVRTFGIHSFTH